MMSVCFHGITADLCAVWHYTFSVQWIYEIILISGWTVQGLNPGGGEIFCTHSHLSWSPPSLLYNGYWVSFPGWKRLRARHWPPFLSSTEVTVELPLYFPLSACMPRSRVNFQLLEKLTVPELANKFPTFFMEPKGWLSHSQVPATCPYPEPTRSNPYPPHPTSWRSILILSSHLSQSLPIGLFPSGFPIKAQYAPLHSPYVLRTPPISFFSIRSPE